MNAIVDNVAITKMQRAVEILNNPQSLSGDILPEFSRVGIAHPTVIILYFFVRSRINDLFAS